MPLRRRDVPGEGAGPGTARCGYDAPPMDTEALHFLHRRRSTPSRLLADPGPDDATLASILATAVRVPDHGRLTPWRFLRIAGEARHRLGAALADIHAAEHPEATAAALDKERGRFSHAPLVIAVIGTIAHGHRIPEVEQRLSGGAVCFQLLLAAQAHGFGAQWLTGWAAYHPAIHARLGLAPDEEILGFVHIGTASSEAPERERPDAAALLTDWAG